MEYILISFVVMAVAALGMAVGVLAGRQPARAGCGRDIGRCAICECGDDGIER